MGSVNSRWHRGIRIARLGAAVFLSLVCLVTLAMLLASVVLQGARFGRLVERNLPRIRGAIHIGGGRWAWPGLWALWRGRAAPFWFDDIRMLDPEGTEVFHAAYVNGELQVDRASGRIGVRNLHIGQATWRFARMQARPEIGFLAAFSPVTSPASGTQGAPDGAVSNSQSAGRFQIFDAHLEGLDAVFAFPEWDLTLRDVHAAGQLTFDGAHGVHPAFVFVAENADVRGGGRVGVLLGPPGRRELSFSRARLNRVATTVDAPDSIFLDASSVMAGRSALAFKGYFTGVYSNGGRATPPGLSADIVAEQAADAIQAILASGADSSSAAAPVSVGGGTTTRLTLKLSGPFSTLSIAADARGFDARRGTFDLRDIGLHVWAQPSLGHAILTGLTATSAQGGLLRVDADADRGRARGTLTLLNFSAAGLVPELLRPLLAGTMNGTVVGQADLRGGAGVSIDSIALSLSRPPGGNGPRIVRMRLPPRRSASGFANGIVSLPSLTASAWGGRLSAGGTIGLNGTPAFDVAVDARNISLARILGPTFVTGTLSFHARARGTPRDLDVRIALAPQTTLGLFSEQFRLPRAVALHLDRDGLAVPELRLDGAHGGTLLIGGNVALDGMMRMVLGVHAFPFAKLPVFVATDLPLAGRLDGRVYLSVDGRNGAGFSASGRLSLDDATFQGRAIGGGTLDLLPETRGAIRVRGQIVEGVSLDGTLRSGRDGLTADAHVRLRDVRLDPFLGSLPGGATAAGVVSGTVEARIAPRVPPLVEGKLTRLLLTVTGPGRTLGAKAAATWEARAPTHAIDLRAVDDVMIFAQASGGQRGGGVIRIKAARFIGNVGSVELGGETSHGRTQTSVRGTLQLGALSDLALDIVRVPWLQRLSGSADVDVNAVVTPDGPPPLLTGSVRLAAAGTLRLAGAAFDVRILNGQVKLRPDRSATLELPLVVGGGTLHLGGGWVQQQAGGARLAIDADGDLDAGLIGTLGSPDIRDATGRVRVKAHLGGSTENPQVSSIIDIGPAGIALTLPGLGKDRVRIAAGRIDVDQRTAVLRDVTVQIGARAHVIIGAARDGPATLRFEPFAPGSLLGVLIPLRGDLTALAVRTTVVDGARFALRLERERTQPFRLSGDVDVVKARVNTRSVAATESGAGATTSALLKRRELRNMQLDLRVHSQKGAVTVNVPYAPDVRIDVDYRVQGTPEHPRLSGDVRSAGLYSRVALALYHLFQ